MRATKAIIHLNNLVHNIELIKQNIKSSCKICLAVKANAYGHGIIEISKTAEKAGVHYFGVATVDEGILLRESHIHAPILLLGIPTYEEIPQLIYHNISPVIGDNEILLALEKEAQKQEKSINCHLKVDTGMGRIGCNPQEAPELARQIHQSQILTLEGLCTHFPGADFKNTEFARQQLGIFNNLIGDLKQNRINPPLIHAANSGAIIGLKNSEFSMVRPGIMAYGYHPSKDQPRKLDLKPVMELKTRISFIKKVPAGTPVSYGMTYRTERDTIIATLPLGYGDGYSRLLSNQGEVLIRGQKYPVAGRICMDQCMIDLGPHTDIKRNEEVVLFGPDLRGPSAEDIADLMGTIPYETTCLITSRVPRVFQE